MAEVPDLGDQFGVLITQFPSELLKTRTPLAPRVGRTTNHHVCWGRYEADDCAQETTNVKTENGRSH